MKLRRKPLMLYRYTANGDNQLFDVPFDFMSRADIKVIHRTFTDDTSIASAPYTWPSEANQIRLEKPLENADECIVVYRETSLPEIERRTYTQDQLLRMLMQFNYALEEYRFDAANDPEKSFRVKKQEIGTRILELRDLLERAAAEIQNFKTEVTTVKGGLDGYAKTSLDTSLTNKLTAIEKDVDDQIHKLLKDAAEEISGYKADAIAVMNQDKEEAQGRLAVYEKKAKEETEKKLQEIGDAILSKTGELIKKSFDEKDADIKNRIVEAKEALKNSVEVSKEAVANKKDEALNALEGKKVSLSRDMDTKAANLKNAMKTSLNQELAKAKKAIDAPMPSILNTIATQGEAIKKEIEAFGDKHKQVINNLVNDPSTGILKKVIETSVDAYKAEIQTLVDDPNIGLKTQIETAKDEIIVEAHIVKSTCNREISAYKEAAKDEISTHTDEAKSDILKYGGRAISVVSGFVRNLLVVVPGISKAQKELQSVQKSLEGYTKGNLRLLEACLEKQESLKNVLDSFETRLKALEEKIQSLPLEKSEDREPKTDQTQTEEPLGEKQ